MSSLSPQKSTTVRATRWSFRLGELAAPRLTARALARTWFRLPPPRPAGPVPPGGTPFVVTSQRGAVRGMSWGDGPVVYLVHGWGGRGDQLAGFIGPLVDVGHRVVLFDGPSHGLSDPGPTGPGSSNAVELGRALDDVAARFGPATAVVAHSMGALATMLALRDGWLGTQRLVLLAPMARLSTQRDAMWTAMGVGRRTDRHVERLFVQRVGQPVADFDLATLGRQVDPVPTLLVHDRADRTTSYDESAQLAAELPDATLVGTEGLGHHRLLVDPGVVETAAAFAATGAMPPGGLRPGRKVGGPARVA